MFLDLYNAVCVNPELGIPALDVLWFHFMEFYVMDEETNLPINFCNIAVLREKDCILQVIFSPYIRYRFDFS